MNRKKSSIFFIIGTLILFSMCRPDSPVLPVDGLYFSKDTVFFDTIFTKVGSITKQLKVYNGSKDDITIQSIHLGDGDESEFRLNIDGFSGNKKENVLLRAKDSMFIFVEVTIDPTLDEAPMVVEDSIIFITDNKIQDVNLLAWGQNMHLYFFERIEMDTWVNDIPYLIYGNAVVDSGKTLTIEAGAKVHLHRYSSLLVYGTLIINGTKDEPVVIQGDRLDDVFEGYSYEDVPGQWGTIAFLPGSADNLVNYAIIRNGTAGMQVGHPGSDENPNITITNTVIDNMNGSGIYAFGAEIEAYNTIISNCGNEAIAIYKGGNYNFTHCTLANYWDRFPGFSNRRSPALLISNYGGYYVYNEEEEKYEVKEIIGDLENANFGNCIIYGNLQNELLLADTNIASFNCNIEYSLIKLEKKNIDLYSEYFQNNYFEADSLFLDVMERDYQLDTLSSAIDLGSLNIARKYPVDYNGNSRVFDSKPDLGAFEFQD